MLTSDYFWLVALGLLVWCAGYAWFLNLPQIQKRYVPDWTAATVAGGFAWVDLAMAALAARGYFGWEDIGALFILEVAAGIPIVIWQYIQYRGRKRLRAQYNGNGGGTHERKDSAD